MRAAVFLVLIVLTSWVGLAQTNVQSPYSITISAEQPVVESGSEIELDIQVKNSSNGNLDWGANWENGLNRNFEYEVRNENGGMVPKLVYPHPEIGFTFNVTAFLLKPGEAGNAGGGTISLLYDMRKPGRYVIQASRFAPGEPKVIVRSNTITVTVKP